MQAVMSARNQLPLRWCRSLPKQSSTRAIGGTGCEIGATHANKIYTLKTTAGISTEGSRVKCGCANQRHAVLCSPVMTRDGELKTFGVRRNDSCDTESVTTHHSGCTAYKEIDRTTSVVDSLLSKDINRIPPVVDSLLRLNVLNQSSRLSLQNSSCVRPLPRLDSVNVMVCTHVCSDIGTVNDTDTGSSSDQTVAECGLLNIQQLCAPLKSHVFDFEAVDAIRTSMRQYTSLRCRSYGSPNALNSLNTNRVHREAWDNSPTWSLLVQRHGIIKEGGEKIDDGKAYWRTDVGRHNSADSNRGMETELPHSKRHHITGRRIAGEKKLLGVASNLAKTQSCHYSTWRDTAEKTLMDMNLSGVVNRNFSGVVNVARTQRCGYSTGRNTLEKQVLDPMDMNLSGVVNVARTQRHGYSTGRDTLEKQLLELMDMWKLEKAVALLRRRVEGGAVPHANVLLNLQQQLANLGEVECLLQVHDLIKEHNLVSDDKFFHCLQEAYYNSGRVSEGVEVLRMLYHGTRKFADVDVFFTLLSVMILRHFPDRIDLILGFVTDLKDAEVPVLAPEASLWKCYMMMEQWAKADNLLVLNEELRPLLPQQVARLCQNVDKAEFDRAVVLSKVLELPFIRQRLRVLVAESLLTELSHQRHWQRLLKSLKGMQSSGLPLHANKVLPAVVDLRKNLAPQYDPQIQELKLWCTSLPGADADTQAGADTDTQPGADKE